MNNELTRYLFTFPSINSFAFPFFLSTELYAATPLSVCINKSCNPDVSASFPQTPIDVHPVPLAVS